MKKTQSILAFLLLFSTASLSQFVDTDFNPPIAGVPEVYAHEVQYDGKILLSGNFVVFENQPVGSIIRVNEDGTLDEGFEITEDIGNTIIDRIEEISEDYILVCSRNQGGSWVLNNDGSLKTNLDEVLKADSDYVYTLGAFVLDENSLFVRKEGNKREFIKVDLKGNIDNRFQRTFLPNQDRPLDIAIQNDGKIIVVGYHSPIANDTQYGLIRRFNKDGSEDGSFITGTGSGKNEISDVEIDNFGRIYLAGNFNSFNETSVQYNVLRLLSNGNIDHSFSLEETDQYGKINVKGVEILPDGFAIVIGVSDLVQAQLVLKIDEAGNVVDSFESTKFWPKNSPAKISTRGNNILVTGGFHRANNQDKYGMVRINEGGSLNKGFDLEIGAMAYINSTVLQMDGKVLIGGEFSTLSNIAQLPLLALRSISDMDVLKVKNIARLNPDGSIDDFFSPFQHVDRIESMVELGNGQYLVSGVFRSINKEGLIRLNHDGSIDETFEVTYFGQESIAKMSSGNQVIVGGGFNSVNGKLVSALAKIDLDGNVVETFNTNNLLPENYTVQAIDSLHDGSILVGGFYGPTLTAFLWKLDKNASEIEFKLKELPYYSVNNFKVLEDRILVSGATNNPPCPVFQIDFDGNSIDQTSFSLTSPDPLIFDFQPLEHEEWLIGGRFDQINGVNHNSLVKVGSKGKVKNNYTINLHGYRSFVKDISLINSDSVYISGHFKGINNLYANGIFKLSIYGSPNSNTSAPSILALEGKEDLNQVKVYPMPCTNYINLKYSEALSKNEVHIHDLSGKTVFTGQFDSFSGNTTINTSKFQRGIYFLTLRHGGQSFTRKIIKN
ncbi:MAG: T9SS type A sorting domain-containing protein [Cyclobacteriaceae bacterium]